VEVQKRSWRHAYFRSEVAKHPDLTPAEAIDHSAWYLMNHHIQVPEYGDWRWQLVAEFPPGSNKAPEWREYWEYLYLLLPVIVGAVGPWLLIHTTAWIVAGFRNGGTHSTSGTQV
jgi:hypothetical protein